MKLNVGQALYLLAVGISATRQSAAKIAEELKADVPGNDETIERAVSLLQGATTAG